MLVLFVLAAVAVAPPLLANTEQPIYTGIVGVESARIAYQEGNNVPYSLSISDRIQYETMLQVSNANVLGLKWSNITAAKWDNKGSISALRNWGYGYWSDSFGLSVDAIKGNWSGSGPNILAIGLASKDCEGNFCWRINPTLAAIDIYAEGTQKSDSGWQLNTKLDYRLSDRFTTSFHPQYASWRSDDLGSTLKLEANLTARLGNDSRSFLMLVYEQFMVNNQSTGMKTRYVGEGTPLAGYVQGTESTWKLRYMYRF